MFVGETGIARIVQRTCEVMKEHDTDDVRREAEFKTALCLLELPADRGNEAELLLAQLMLQDDSRWTPLAACQLWARKLQQKDFTAADEIFEIVSENYTFVQLGAALPKKLQDEILQTYQRPVQAGLWEVSTW